MDGETLREVSIKISQYFRDFLESDFKRQQAPRRRVVFQTDTGFRCGMRLKPYDTLEQDFWSQLGKPSGGDLSLRIQPRKYTRPMSAFLKTVITQQIEAIDETAILVVQQQLREKIQTTFASAVNDVEKWIAEIRSTLASEIGLQIIRPLIAHLDGPLKIQAYSLMDSLYAAESDMVSMSGAEMDRLLPDVLANYLVHQDKSVLDEALNHGLNLDVAKTGLRNFFQAFITADAFTEFRDLQTYATTTDGMQLYLYIGSIAFRKVQYPLFFVPIEAEKQPDGSGYSLKLVNNLYVNRKAIDFVLQELANERQREWVSPIQERINYMTPEQTIYEVARTLFRLVANAVDLAGNELSSRAAEVSNSEVTLSTALTLAAFESGEEAIVNDYEELIDLARKGGSNMVELFETMVKGILKENPISITSSVDAQWDGQSLSEKLIFDSPIPLNEEQRKVLLAVRNPVGRIIVVEGPPGTGKSHTITAIAADCAFNKKSCLILSDKAEALTVVQDKLSEAMSRVRHDRNFPNPLLRLGQQDANFKRLTANQTINQVSAYARAMRANQSQLQEELQDTRKTLAEAIEKTVSSLGSIGMREISEMHADEAELARVAPAVLERLKDSENSELLLEFEQLAPVLADSQTYLRGIFEQSVGTVWNQDELWERVRRDTLMLRFSHGISTSDWGLFRSLNLDDLQKLSILMLRFEQLKMPLFGYLFRGSELRALESQLNSLSVSSPQLLRPNSVQLKRVVTQATQLRDALDTEGLGITFEGAFTWFARKRPVPVESEHALKVLRTLRRLDTNLVDDLLAVTPKVPSVWIMAVRFLKQWMSMKQSFSNAPNLDYIGTKSKLERLNTSVMNSHVDARLINFMENNRADAKTLAGIISSKQKFPEEKFSQVKDSFPVIIASIREFGNFMPLLPDLFDVVVIDEASQVSVAQALPAILRAKKVVVLGDSKQFSNVKSANASNALNDKYRSELVQYFQRTVKQDASSLQRLANFDVKKSILEWCSMSASYSIMLRKHFRSYQELISYSSATFYDHQLQALKIRGVKLDEVIQFSQVELEGRHCSRSINQAEADFILEQLLEMLEDSDCPTVGIITPFREQHTLLSKLLHGHAMASEFEDKLRLKVMTFDSCQGEERQVIFYSMVATEGMDALNYIFPISLTDAREKIEEKLKLQRLNVGFSRAQEKVWFVHSMPLDQYKGAIGHAMNHYKNLLKRNAVSVDMTDQNSPMEAKVLDWLQKTPFYSHFVDQLEIQPQFPIGDYLKQLDPTYKHPAWRVDFLLTISTETGRVFIVIEYDGFEYHFDKSRDVHVGNHERYLRDTDVERQLTLESYGYRFLRINRFNLGRDPVVTLSERLTKLLEMATGEQVSSTVQTVQQQTSDLVNKQAKTCSRCNEIRDMQLFFDPTLKVGEGGFGRVCMDCKDSDVKAANDTKASRPATHNTWKHRRKWGRY